MTCISHLETLLLLQGVKMPIILGQVYRWNGWNSLIQSKVHLNHISSLYKGFFALFFQTPKNHKFSQYGMASFRMMAYMFRCPSGFCPQTSFVVCMEYTIGASSKYKTIQPKENFLILCSYIYKTPVIIHSFFPMPLNLNSHKTLGGSFSCSSV